MRKRLFALLLLFSVAGIFALTSTPPAVGATDTEAATTVEATTVLQPGWNLAGWTQKESGVGAIFEAIPSLELVYAWESERQRFSWAVRDAPGAVGDLEVLRPGMGLWLYLGGGEAVSWTRPVVAASALVEVREGWNLVAWGGSDRYWTSNAINDHSDSFAEVWGWDATRQTFVPHRPDPGGSPLASGALSRGSGYWIRSAAHTYWAQSGWKWLLPWVKQDALSSLNSIIRNNPPLAWQMFRAPFLDPPFLQRDAHVLDTLDFWSSPGDSGEPALLAQLEATPWFSDGLDDNGAALLFALSYSPADYRAVLFESNYVESRRVALSLAGEVSMAIVSDVPFPTDRDVFEILESGAQALEAYLGAPFPSEDIILHLVGSSFPGFRTPGRVITVQHLPHDAERVDRTRFFLVVAHASKRTIFHELAHHYHVGGPLWFYEGLAHFLEAVADSETGGLSFQEYSNSPKVAAECPSNIWAHSHEEYLTKDLKERCARNLGEQFFFGMHEEVGPETVAAAIRELYDQALLLEATDAEAIYYAFLSNVSEGKEGAFQAAYSRYHGGPTPDPPSRSPEFPSLVALYNATSGEHWAHNRNWLSEAPLGAWHGVVTGETGQVTRLLLSREGLSGEIPPELGNMPSLRLLDLGANQLVGGIPLELGKLSNLQQLWLGFNQLDGTIPSELGKLANLTHLYLAGNHLSGEIPPELGNFVNLDSLHLESNELSGGIPPELGNLARLRSLTLANNQLGGEIPAELGNLPNLGSMGLHGNELSGEIPPELGNLANLRTLSLGGNRLVGAIPPELGELTSLTQLLLNGNQLSGEIHPALGNLSNLTSLELANNQLTGEIPAELGNLTNLRVLVLEGNQLSGEIPSELGNLTSLDALMLDGNHFTGCLAPELPKIWVKATGLPRCE